MSSEEKLNSYKAKSDIAMNLASILAIFIGGGWFLFEFVALKKIEIAEAEAKYEFSRLSIEIKPTPIHTAEGTCLIADVYVTNIGTKPVPISCRWGKSEKPEYPNKPSSKLTYHPPLAVYKVEFNAQNEVNRYEDSGEEVLKNSIFGHPMTIPAKSEELYQDDSSHSATVTWELIRVGETRKIPFIVRVTEPGIYLVSYRIFVGFSKEEKAVYARYADRDRDGATWSSRTYVNIESVVPPDKSTIEREGRTPLSAVKPAENGEAEEEEEEEEE